MMTSSGEPNFPHGFLGPDAVDGMIRQAIQTCWMMLPADKRNVETVSAEIRRLVERALTNLKEDSETFGLP